MASKIKWSQQYSATAAELIEVAAALLVAIIAICRHSYFFRDFGIVWEGAYRLSLGQAPYTDFGLPMGPVTFLLPAFLFKILGASFAVFKIAGIFVGLLTLVAFRSCLKNLDLPPLPRAVCVLIFAVYTLSAVPYPWYDSQALACEMVAFACLLNRRASFALGLIAGILTIGAVLSNRTLDTSPISCLTVFLIIIAYLSENRGLRRGYGFGLILAIAAFYSWVHDIELFYWADFGQPPHPAKLWWWAGHPFLEALAVAPVETHLLLKFMVIIAALLALIALGLIRLRSLSHLIAHGSFAFILMIQNLLTLRTMALPQLSGTYFIAPALSLVLAIAAGAGRNARWAIYGLAGFLIFSLPPAFGISSLKHWWANEVVDVAGTPMSGQMVMGKTMGIPTLSSEWISEAIARELANARVLLGGPVKKCPVLNMSELTFLASDWHYTPCVGLPLWYHSGVSLYAREFDLIRRRIDQHEIAVVLLQNTYEPWAGTYADLAQFLLRHGYQQRAAIPGTDPQKPIFVYKLN